VERNGAPRGRSFHFLQSAVVNRQLGIVAATSTNRGAWRNDSSSAICRRWVFANNGWTTEVLVTYSRTLRPGPARGETGAGIPRRGYLRASGARSSGACGRVKSAAWWPQRAGVGIDIGSLDAVVWRAIRGRSLRVAAVGAGGRRQALGGRAGGSSAPLDQYIVEHPDYFFGRSPEHAYINPNLEILLRI